MAHPMELPSRWVAGLATLLALAIVTPVAAQVLNEDFDNVTGTGGGVFFYGVGYGDTGLLGWDDGISGEGAFGSTFGNLHADVAAQGSTTGGVDGGGAGVFSVSDLNHNMLDEDFDAVSGLGGGVFLTEGQSDASMASWDTGISGEEALSGVYGGAVVLPGGGASAQGLPTGDALGRGAGRIAVSGIDTSSGGWYGGLAWQTAPFPAVGALQNGSFDDSGGTMVKWTVWGYAFSEAITPRSGTHACKTYGTFTGGPNSSGIYQRLASVPGQVWEFSAYVRHNDLTGDPLHDSLMGTQNYVQMKIEFRDGANLLDVTTNTVIDGSDPVDTWLAAPPLTATAPAGTTEVRAILEFVQPNGLDHGAALIDDVNFRRVGGPANLELSEYTLLADVMGSANTGAGEVYGGYQLRIEDSAGNRLVFHSPGVANGSWATLGGTLDHADEENAEGIGTNGMFNHNSPTYRVVVAFENEEWGSGGTLTVDNLVLTNSHVSGDDDYWGGLLWENLPAPGIGLLDKLMLKADVKGSVPGGKYQLRLEGYDEVPCLNEDFAALTSDSERTVVSPGEGGGTFYNWNDELQYEIGLFGLVDGVVTSSGGVWMRGLATGGVGGGGAAQIEVLDVSLQANGHWWAGLVWENRRLGSSSLSALHLRADVKGEWNAAYLQEPPHYMLRVEDPDGDYLGFNGVANGSYQAVGGCLSDADTNGAASGSDGVFDATTDGLYKVVVVFEGWGSQNPPWGNWGGTLTVDNVELAPCGPPSLVQAGVVAFTKTATGAFQSVGGPLSTADVTSFQGEGGIFWQPGDQNWGISGWDSGIAGENAFAGYWGGGRLGTVAAQGCVDCGSNGSGGGSYQWTGSGTTGGGGWWLGVAWPLTLTFSNPSEVRLVGDFIGAWNPAEGQTPGSIYFKLESSPNNMRQFRIPAMATTNGWYHVDDTLDHANLVGVFIYGTQRQYTLVVSSYGIDASGDWGTGGNVYFDNFKVIVNGQTKLAENFNTVMGPTFTALANAEGKPLEAYSVVVAMEDGSASWGSGGGTLAVDNLRFTLAASCDVDDDLDLADFARFQTCFSGEGGGVAGGCDCSDVDGDNDVDLADHELLSNFYTGPQ